MSTPVKCRICKKSDAVMMCGKLDCLQFFCATCPFCAAGRCGVAYHNQYRCWDNHAPEFADDYGSHIQCSLEDHEFVHEILHREADPKRQETLHKEDREALWFITELGEEIVVPDLQSPGTCTTTRYGMLHATDRLNILLAKETSPGNPRRLRFPAVVSFIGETGAGKSTLIRALIKESAGGETKNRQSQIEMPVSQSSTQSLTDPTSSGVHLYKDPGTFESLNPILFADCEGFNAGGTSAASFPKDLATDKHIVAKFPMTASSYITSAMVEDLYAKSLYTFSDTVCFVINNAQTVGQSMGRLLCWAVTGSGTAVHALSQKTLVLILNAPRSKCSEDVMDENVLRAIFLGDNVRFWEDYPMLNDIRNAAFRDAPVTAEKFLRLYFSTISVLYIPNGSLQGVHPGDIRLQLRKLQARIKDDIGNIARIRQDTWTQYNERDFTRLFYLAVEHFSSTNGVFNFFEAEKGSSLDHRDLKDHILAMRRQFGPVTAVDCGARFPATVASALVNKVLREDIANFNRNLQWKKFYGACRMAIDRFYKYFRTCQFTEDGKRCIQTLKRHGPTHRDKDGVIIKKGEFEPTLEEIDKLVASETAAIEYQFNTQYAGLFQDEIHEYPAPAQIVQHRRDILSQAHCPDFQLYSYRTCFACLNAIPDHVLPCGHALCETCAIDFGKPMDEQAGTFRLEECVFGVCGKSWAKETQIIQTKPTFAGVRILTLDGAGVRGILELAMLSLLEEMIGLDLHISCFFDLIVGTGTGGIIALGAGVEQMDLSYMREKFTSLAVQTFGVAEGAILLNMGLLLTIAAATTALPAVVMTGGLLLLTGWGINAICSTSKYATRPLRNKMKDFFGTEASLFGSAIRQCRQRSTRVAVMCIKDGVKATAITNYNRPLTDLLLDGDNTLLEPLFDGHSPEDFERAENEGDDLMAWEAALCTSVSPPYLKPFIKQSSKTVYIDSGWDHNNPVFWAAEEYRKIWDRPGSEAKLDILVSIGAGTFATTTNPELLATPTVQGQKGERIWSDFMRTQTKHSAVSHRLNVTLEGLQCKPDDHTMIGTMVSGFNKAIVHQDHHHIMDKTSSPVLRDQINLIAHILVAKLFFFDPIGPVTVVKDTSTGNQSVYRIEGKILCRLQQGSKPLEKLVERIVAFCAVESEGETHQIQAAQASEHISSIDVTEVKEAVRKQRKFEINHTITTSDPHRGFQAIYIQLQHKAAVPELQTDEDGELPKSKAMTLDCIDTRLAISGFPCRFYDLTKRTPAVSTGGN